MPPSIQDTYFALNILDIFWQTSKDEFNYSPSLDKELKEYLGNYRLEKGKTSLKLLFYYLVSCSIAGIKLRHPDEHILSLQDNTLNLEDKFYAKRILKEYYTYDMETKPQKIKRWRTVKELRMLLYISDGTAGEIDKRYAIKWINACQNPDGGFGFLPNSTSFIENTYFSLHSFSLLNEFPRHPERILNFILSCYTGKGAFSRKRGGTSFLDATYYAIKCLPLITDLTQKFLS